MSPFTKEELKNMAILISLAPIKGGESPKVAMLLQKIDMLLNPADLSESKPKKNV